MNRFLPGTRRLFAVLSLLGSSLGLLAAISMNVSAQCQPTISVWPDTVVCAGTQVVLTAYGASNFSWDKDSSRTDSALVIYPRETHTYTVYTSGSGCIGTASVTIYVNQPPQVNITVTGNSATANVTGGTPPYHYGWSNNEMTPTISGLATGAYTLVVSDSLGCTTTAVANVGCDVSIAATATTICPGNTVTLTASGADSFQWLPDSNSSSSSITVNPYYTTTYQVNGMTGTCKSNSYITIIVDHPTVSISASGTSATANVKGGIPPYLFHWSDGQTTPTATNLANGTLTLVVIDSLGCMALDTIIVGGTCSAAFTIQRDTVNSNNYIATNMAHGAGPLHYDWSWGDGTPDDTNANPVHVFYNAGTYNVCLTIMDGFQSCTNTVCNPLLVTSAQKDEHGNVLTGVMAPVTLTVVPGVAASIELPQEADAVALFPNPAFDLSSVRFTLRHTSAVRISAFDISGQKVAELENDVREAGVHSLSHSAAGLPAGNYWLKLEAEGRTVVAKLVIVK